MICIISLLLGIQTTDKKSRQDKYSVINRVAFSFTKHDIHSYGRLSFVSLELTSFLHNFCNKNSLLYRFERISKNASSLNALKMGHEVLQKSVS